MEFRKIVVDFSGNDGAVKPMHGVNCAPYSFLDREFTVKAFRDGKIPYCRLHDCMGLYGASHFVDIPNLFPDFNADENDPSNYDFTLTDEYIGTIRQAGTKIVYRLGITIDWGSKKYHTMPPKDFGKWARICEHVVRHYNEGWADGYEWNLEDWEIWNEPENPPMWSGTKEEYFQLYAITAKHLKTCFPDIKVGGYGGCGFYAITRPHMNDFFKSFIVWFTEFLDYLKYIDAPLDFYSWHIYNEDPEEVLVHAAYVRKMLDEKGFDATESSLNEWNYGAEGASHMEKKNMIGASYVTSVMCRLQYSGIVDSAMYYDANKFCIYNGLFRPEDNAYLKAFYPLCAWGQLWTLGTYHKPKMNTGDGIYACAASNEKEGGVLISNIGDEDAYIELQLDGLNGATAKFYLLDDGNDMALTRTEIFRGDTVIPVVRVEKRAVVYVALEK